MSSLKPINTLAISKTNITIHLSIKLRFSFFFGCQSSFSCKSKETLTDLTFKSLHLDGTKSLHQFVSKNPDIKKGKDEKPIQLTVIVGVQAFKAAIQANNENMTHGLQKLHDMLINLGLNANKNHEDDGSNYQGYYTCGQPIDQCVYNLNDIQYFDVYRRFY